ncbi:MAG TPA: hypothetical protein VGK58_14695 [Lacipirellulaceae bacterium]
MAMRNYARKFVILIMVGIGAVGCDSSTNSGGGASMGEMAAALDAKRATEQKEQARLEAERTAEEARQAAAAAARPPAERPRKEAGRAPVGEGGYLTAIVGARRHILNQVEDWPWLQAVQHFQATEGRLPKDHDEFMNKIVKPLGINLGFKEEGQEFLYDPTPSGERPWGTLYVVDQVEAPTPDAPQPGQ